MSHRPGKLIHSRYQFVIAVQVMVNEEVDPSLVIKRLKQEIRDLKDEIRLVLLSHHAVCFLVLCHYTLLHSHRYCTYHSDLA